MSPLSMDMTDAIVQALLIQQGQCDSPSGTGTAGPWPVYDTQEPPYPDNCVTARDTVGVDDYRLMNTGELVVHYGCQLRIRSTDHEVGYAKAFALRKYLAESAVGIPVSVLENCYKVYCFSGIGQVNSLGKEPQTGRFIFTVNALVVYEKLN